MDKITLGVQGVSAFDGGPEIDWMRPPEKRAKIVTIFGDGGLGKTTFGAICPKPLIVMIEDGSSAITQDQYPDVRFSPICKKLDDVFYIINELATKRHDRKTVVFDTITQLDSFIVAEILALDFQQSGKFRALKNALGGYGAGGDAVAAAHGRLREAVESLTAKGMNVVFLAHSTIETVNQPDQEPYQRFTIKLGKESLAHYVNNVDLVGMIKLEMFTRGQDREVNGKQIQTVKKAVGSGCRVMTCYPHPAHVSKNRFGIQSDLVWDGVNNPIGDYL